MTKNTVTLYILTFLFIAVSCVDNELEVSPDDSNFPFQLILDQGEGGDLADAEDYDLEVTFADYVGTLPNAEITFDYAITDLEDDMEGNVRIDRIVYEVEDDDCVFTREINFTASQDNLSGTITLRPDAELKSVPESFEIIFALPGADDTEGSFSFEIRNLRSSANVVIGSQNTFEYEVFDNDLAGEWEMELDEESFEEFKRIFGPLSHELEELAYEDITGDVSVEFEYSEINIEIELAEEEEIVTCEDGEVETETDNKILEIEADYEAEDGDLQIEGSYYVLGDDGEVEDELDFILESSYELSDDENLMLTFFKLIGQDNFKDGDELFKSDDGVSFALERD